VQDLAILADDERLAPGQLDQRELDSIEGDDLGAGVGDEGELGADLATEGRGCCLAITGDGEDLGLAAGELVVPILVR
jgi:hypothetical protein